jgi:hypothetical protein
MKTAVSPKRILAIQPPATSQGATVGAILVWALIGADGKQVREQWKRRFSMISVHAKVADKPEPAYSYAGGKTDDKCTTKIGFSKQK